jgi:hypothetical protein
MTDQPEPIHVTVTHPEPVEPEVIHVTVTPSDRPEPEVIQVKMEPANRPAVPDVAPDDVVQTPGTRWVLLIDAAQALNVSPDTVRRRVRRGELPGKHENGRLLVELPTTVENSATRGGHDHELAVALARVELLEREREQLIAELEARRRADAELRGLVSQAQSLASVLTGRFESNYKTRQAP